MTPEQINRLLGIIIPAILSFYSLRKIFERLKNKDQGFGPMSVKIIGASILLPSLIILSITTEISREAIVGLIGTITGYLLSESMEK